MTKKISGAEYALSKIFSAEFEFVVPEYQRPYAWTVDQASELLDDLIAFHNVESEEGYFLGSIVLIKAEGAPRSEVIDGQQRLTTLSILLSVMACAYDGKHRSALGAYLFEPGKELEGISPKPRLSLRTRDQPFFKKYIQELNIPTLVKLDAVSLDNEAQRNICENARYLLTEIEKRFETPEALKKFVTFLLTRCYLVAVSTPTQASAFRVFSVMNSRGLDLQPTDIIKADVIGQLKSEVTRKEYNKKWEEMEIDLTRSGFNDLFSYIRMIYAKDKAKRSLLEEFRTHVLPNNLDPAAFIDDVLEPFAAALNDIRTASFTATAHSEDVNNYITWLNRIDNSDWIPPAMLFLQKNRHEPAKVARFFQLLERLAAFMHIDRYNVNDRIEAYSELIAEIEADIDPDEMDSLYFDEEWSKKFQKALEGEIYQLTPRRRNYIILRLDSFVSDGAATYDPKILTIEHVLPQTVNEESEWAKWWPDERERERWVHRLANLIPLNKKRNSAAQNYDFSTKCDVYFSGTKNVSSYALTSQVILQDDWTPTTVKARQQKLINILMKKWELN